MFLKTLLKFFGRESFPFILIFSLVHPYLSQEMDGAMTKGTDRFDKVLGRKPTIHPDIIGNKIVPQGTFDHLQSIGDIVLGSFR